MKITARSVEDFLKAEEILESIKDKNFIKDIDAAFDSTGLHFKKVVHGNEIELPNTLRVANVDITFPSIEEKTKQIRVQARVQPSGEWIYIMFIVCNAVPYFNVRAKEAYHVHATTI